MILHTVNKSPFEKSTLTSCLKHCKKGSSLLLIEDGVYAALNNTKYTDRMLEAMETIKVFVLAPDLNARGVQDKLIDGIEIVDYGGFVDLSIKHDKVEAWL